MTPRNLFIIILKILGIFFIKDIVEAIPPVLSEFHYLGSRSNTDTGISLFVFSLLIFMVYVLVSYLLIFESESIVGKLKLDKGFDQEKFSLEFSPYSIFTIAFIVTGLFIIIVEIPNFCQQLYSYFQMRQFTLGQTPSRISYIVFTGIKIIIGLLLIGERKRIVDFILKRQEIKANE